MPVSDTPDPKLLQALEHTLETLKRTSDVSDDGTRRKAARRAVHGRQNHRLPKSASKREGGSVADGGITTGALESGGEALVVVARIVGR
jgi:hypothetical protein